MTDLESRSEAADAGRKLLQLAFAFLFMPVLGWLLGATIINGFTDRYAPDPALRPGDTYVVAQQCNRHGPISTHGFGFWHQCMADTYIDGEKSPARKPVNFLTPADIGKKVPVEFEGSGRRGHHVRAADQPLAMWAWLTVPFGLVWLYLIYLSARPILRKMKTEIEEDQARPAEPSHEVKVVGGRKMWLGFKGHVVVLILAGVAAVRSTPWAFQEYPQHTAMAVGGWAVLLLVVGNWVRRMVVMPTVTISAKGMDKLTWAEIAQVHLTTSNTLMIRPHAGDTVRIGRFGDDQVTQIDAAIRQYGTAPYTRETASPAV